MPAIKGTRALLSILGDAGYDPARIKIILNRYSRFEGNLSPELASQGLDRSIDYVLPYDKKLHEAANEGVPYLSKHRGSAFSQGIEKIVLDLAGGAAPEAPAGSFFQRLLSR